MWKEIDQAVDHLTTDQVEPLTVLPLTAAFRTVEDRSAWKKNIKKAWKVLHGGPDLQGLGFFIMYSSL